MAFKPSDKRKFVAEEAELNLLPILNMIIVLIPLLLTSAEWVKLGLLETRLPPAAAAGGGGGAATETEAPLPKLSLLVAVDEAGAAVSIEGATSETGEAGKYTYFPMTNGAVDYDAISKELWRIRKDLVLPSIKGKEQAVDDRGKVRVNPDGSPMMVDAYGFDDAETVIISAPNEMPFQDLVKLLDATRQFKDPQSGRMEKLFPTPMMGKIN